MDKYILFAGRRVPIHTNYPVFRFDDDSGPSYYHPEKTLTPDRLMQMALLRPTMMNYSFRGNLQRTAEQLFSVPREEADRLGEIIWQIALHHDVTMNALDTYNVLCTRGLSTHFCVNYDGALYQYMDPYHVAWATGDNNGHSLAIDMNNPVFPELQEADPANGMREIYQGKVNGSIKTMLGYTEPQYETIIALLKALVNPIDVPNEPPWTPLPLVRDSCFPPISETGEVINCLLKDSINFHGFLGHYHCSSNKWDPGPAFDWLRVLSGIKGERNSLPILLGEPGEQRNMAQCGGTLLEELFHRYYQNVETSSGGWYPVGTNQAWHSGIHLTAEEGTPVMSMMKGTIVAIRNIRPVDLGDASFVLIRHERKENTDDGETILYWYSLYMHLDSMYKQEKFAGIDWVSALIGANAEIPDTISYNLESDSETYIRGVPQVMDARVKTDKEDEILEAFFRGDILLTNIPCKAGEIIGHIGKFGDSPDKTRHVNQIHVEFFSTENLFARGAAHNEAWNIIEGDYSDSSLVRVKRLLKPIKDFVQAQTGRTPPLLKSSEIGGFYSMSDEDMLALRRDDFRKAICYHRSEWSPQMNWTKTAVQSVGWQWESEASFGKWLVLWLPFQWMTKEVADALDFPEQHSFYTYHPIYLLEQLNRTYAGDISQTAEEASEAEMRNNASLMASRIEDLVKLNKKLENHETLSPEEEARQQELYALMDDHMGDEEYDKETNYEYESVSEFNTWEPGEWPVPKTVDLKKAF
ncbi:MAG: N-acetylmuramoyl-L-alanine amidase [Proteobacteria bacterium]|nr:N-acetylmuramoyl-L-alanine amidase [Pseudomonadota bacterium]